MSWYRVTHVPAAHVAAVSFDTGALKLSFTFDLPATVTAVHLDQMVLRNAAFAFNLSGSAPLEHSADMLYVLIEYIAHQ